MQIIPPSHTPASNEAPQTPGTLVAGTPQKNGKLYEPKFPLLKPFGDIEEYIRTHRIGPRTASFLREANRAPARNPNGYMSNTYYYPCPFVGFTIKGESAWEFAFFLTIVQRPDVVRVFEQGPTQHIIARNKEGKSCSFKCTVDGLVLTNEGKLEVYEVMPNDDAGWESLKNSTRFQALPDGRYVSSPAQAHFAEMGIDHFIVLASALNQNFVQWADFLRPYRTGNALNPITAEEAKMVIDAVRDEPGIFMSDLPIGESKRRAEIVYHLLGRCELWTNCCDCAPSKQKEVRLYPTPLHRNVFDLLRKATRKAPENLDDLNYRIREGTLIEIKGSEFIVKKLNAADYELELESAKDGSRKKVTFQMLLDMKPLIGKIYFAEKVFEAKVATANPEKLLTMLSRHAIIQGNGDIPALGMKSPSARTLRAWAKEIKETEANGGTALEALFPDHGGYKGPHIELRMDRIVNALIRIHYLSPDGESAMFIYLRLRALNKDSRFGRTPDYTTVARRCAALDPYIASLKRDGKRHSANCRPVYCPGILGNPAGTSSGQRAHIDTTPLDLLNKDGVHGFLLRLIDSHDKRSLAHIFSKKEVTHKTIRRLLMKCVRRHKMLPSTITCDWGAEGKSTYIQTTLARLGVTLILRAKATPGAGANIETMFNKLCTELLYNLKGNTRLLQRARMVTKAVDPHDRAVWTDEGIDQLLEEYFDLTNDLPSRSRLSPNVMFAESVKKHGNPPTQFPNFEVFRLAMLTLVEGTTRRVSKRGWVRHREASYAAGDPHQDGAKMRRFAGKDLIVRYDEDDIHHVYVTLPENGNETVKCNVVDHKYKYSAPDESMALYHQVRADAANRKNEKLDRLAAFAARTIEKQDALTEDKKRAEREASRPTPTSKPESQRTPTSAPSNIVRMPLEFIRIVKS